MKKLFIALLTLTLSLALFCASHAEDILGKPFPDFTATDTEGNEFTLSEALKDHDAVLLNIWASWCPPCEAEFPDLNEAYEAYKDRVAFIALSCEPEDTLEVIAEYRRSHGVTFPDLLRQVCHVDGIERVLPFAADMDRALLKIGAVPEDPPQLTGADRRVIFRPLPGRGSGHFHHTIIHVV